MPASLAFPIGNNPRPGGSDGRFESNFDGNGNGLYSGKRPKSQPPKREFALECVLSRILCRKILFLSHPLPTGSVFAEPHPVSEGTSPPILGHRLQSRRGKKRSKEEGPECLSSSPRPGIASASSAAGAGKPASRSLSRSILGTWQKQFRFL